MPLGPGVRLGVYEISALIGAGGMGQVYRARDTRLGRDVAIKVLPPEFGADPERVARFEREAQTLAGLNHPNIGAIYGMEERDGVSALVLELVEGPTLADRIAQAPIPIEEALSIARQIVDAVEAAHEQGIIHRDLRDKKVQRVSEFEHVEAIDAVFSPDGRWIAYDSPEAGRTNVFVRRFPLDAARYQVTKVPGARNPFWWRDGQALKLVYSVGPFTPFEAVALTMQPSFEVGPAVPLPRGPESIKSQLRSGITTRCRPRSGSLASSTTRPSSPCFT